MDIDYAVLRIGRASVSIDGFNLGRLAVRLDPRTGELSGRGLQEAKFSREVHDRHPDSGVEFAGRRLPFWDEMLDLARLFARHAGANRMVAWDVATTPTGPVFVEGNHDWDAMLAQVDGVGLLTDEFVDRMRREAGVVLDNTRLPVPDPLRAVRLLAR